MIACARCVPVALVLPLVPSCAGSDDQHTDLDPAPVLVTLELALTGDASAFGTCSDLVEVATPARTDTSMGGSAPECNAGIELYTGDCSGIYTFRPVFTTTDIGSASVMLDPAWVTWSVNDPDANAARVTDQWSGTMTISTWGAGRVVLDLDGERCDYGVLSTCAPATGTLILQGEFGSPYVATTAGMKAVWQDVGTGDLLCSSDLP